MNAPVATYSFLPWLRQGLSNRITGAAGERARITVPIIIAGDRVDGSGEMALAPIQRDVALIGPGDVIGIEQRAIVRIEPRPWITNFEPNYLPFLEFYDEDFPWRYTPAASSARLTPWITLIVVREDEFKEPRAGVRPLPCIEIADPSTLPLKDDLWAWAHVHVQRGIGPGASIREDNADTASDALAAAVAEDADDACSRIMCARRLAPNTAYHAFLIPTFESGRLAGLGIDAAAPDALHGAWTDYPDRATREPTAYPYYFRWFFRTGATGDFEYLVRKLTPRPVDSRVGRRDVDVQRPGVSVAGLSAPPTLKFTGALAAPRSTLPEEDLQTVIAEDAWFEPFPHAFQEGLARFINLSDAYEEMTAKLANRDYADSARDLATDGATTPPPAVDVIDGNVDPIITPPLYGRWHARTHRLITERDGSPAPHQNGWVHALNLDPRWRAAAGLGAQVVAADQENLMAAAWAQVGALPDANRRIRGAQVSLAVSARWHALVVEALGARDPARVLQITAPAHLRVMHGARTMHAAMQASLTPQTLMSAGMRRAMRPRARLVTKLGYTASAPAHAVLARVDAGVLPATPPKPAAPDLPKVDDTAGLATAAPWPAWLESLADLARKAPWWLIALLAIALLILGFLLGAMAGLAAAAALCVGAILAIRTLKQRSVVRQRATDLTEAGRSAEGVNRLPRSTSFRLAQSFEDAIVPASVGVADSAEASRFKTALRSAYAGETLTVQEGREPIRAAMGFAAAAASIRDALNPRKAVPRRVLHDMSIPQRFHVREDDFDEIMNYPVIDAPMYFPLKELSGDYFVPNLHLIPADSVTLLETNQKFIESYMVGVNYEFGRELLWREYPTDQRGSPFRQFWDVSAYFDPQANGPDAEARRDRLRDIPAIHRWSKDSALGAHDNREEPGAPQEEEVVLVVRGELFKKYPNAVVYAQRAKWPLTRTGAIDLSKERDLVDIAPGQEGDRTKIKTPLYQARASDDVFLFGFDLTVEVARGSTGEHQGDIDKPGWFFIIKERPGEPRFGLDDGDGSQRLETWADLSWGHVPPQAYLAPTPPAPNAYALSEPTDTTQSEYQGRHLQWEDDRAVPWSANVDSADLAYILYQAPALVAVHAAEMLAKPNSSASP